MASHQMTFARIRSFELIAPTRRLAVDDEQAGDPVLLHQVGSLDGERVGAHRLRRAAHDLVRAQRAQVGAGLDQAAQVAVGEDADDRVVAGRRPR